jgi:hypothetical protein
VQVWEVRKEQWNDALTVGVVVCKWGFNRLALGWSNKYSQFVGNVKGKVKESMPKTDVRSV